ncbi:pyridoxal-phosphate dependent enzyme [Georgenia sp. AZ-5]|uniref:pyridoxal-phosphate dependent enzyme n=1 Tax=Georgenia sp. AZ-5 TaxID=3367526 RepID=UPI003753FED8
MTGAGPGAAPGTDAVGAGGLREYEVVCVRCGRGQAGFAYECAACAGAVVVEPARLAAAGPSPATGLWRWAALLPRTQAAVSLGEGQTPLVELNLPGVPPGARVVAKLETLNPTLSFKDRAMALGASAALDQGVRGLAVASTGNAAVAAAAYAAAAGLRCRVLVGTESRAARKLDSCRVYGPEVSEVPGDYSAAYAEARQLEGADWMNVSTTYRNPLLAEAYRPLALELVEQLGAAPSVVVVPVGAGPLLRGVERGFRDAADVGAARGTPVMVGVQAAAVAPLAAAWRDGDWTRSLRTARSWAPTAATAIADAMRGYEEQGLLTLEAARRAGGEIAAVGEDAILDAQAYLASVGLWVEPAAATTLAYLRERPAGWWDGRDGAVVLVLTGHGIKAR